MLVLSRKPTECIHIGDSVVVSVMAIRGNRVQIGIDAPEKVRVLRGELQAPVSVTSGNGPRAAGSTAIAPTESYDPRGIAALETDGPSI